MYSTGFLTPGRADREWGLGLLVVMVDQWRALVPDAHHGSGRMSDWMVQGYLEETRSKPGTDQRWCGRAATNRHRDGDEMQFTWT